MSSTHPDILLLSATVVVPPDARNLARRDTNLRLADYLDTFDFYLAELARGSADGMVLCDNSGFDLEPFAQKVRQAGLADRVELISFQGLDHPARYGRGYGEFKLVDHAMSASALIARAGANARVWKVTGRYKIHNLTRLIVTQPEGADLYCHCRNRPVPWLDMYLMRWNRRAYDEIIRGVYRKLEQDATPTSAEQLFRRVLDGGSFTSKIVRRFRHVPDIDGIRGGDNLAYGAMKRKYWARVLANRLIPWVWI
jgi:hypothetical protein